MPTSDFNPAQFHHLFLTGIKGVAMTAMAQILLDDGLKITGSDVTENFVTDPVLRNLPIQVVDLTDPLPADIDGVVFTAAHHGSNQPQVQAARRQNLPIFSQAQVLAHYFNQKNGIAVCGVGGKTTTSAMLAWTLDQLNYQPSFFVGVGQIKGLTRTGGWQPQSKFFVAEADEYVIDPDIDQQQQTITPKLAFLKPQIVICNHLCFDHPDIYYDFNQTKQIFSQFFQQIKPGGRLIINRDQPELTDLVAKIKTELAAKNIQVITFGTTPTAEYRLTNCRVENQRQISDIHHEDQLIGQLTLSMPGQYNCLNALAASLALHEAGIDFSASWPILAHFAGTKRRFEFIGEKNQIQYYDDYAHHPDEIGQVLNALKQWHPATPQIVAFQPHTYSRTKQLLADFAQVLATAPELVLLDIFASARETNDPTISSQTLAAAIHQLNPELKITLLKNPSDLAVFCRELPPGRVVMTIGAGNIYLAHDLI